MTVSPGWIVMVRSGPASEPRSRMNPHGASDTLRQLPSGPWRSKAAATCVPRRSSGTTIRPSGVSWLSHAGAKSLTPTVAITRS